MSESSGAAGNERRAQLGAAAIVGLVVLVLGFGSGIGAVFERNRADEDAAAPPAGATTASVGAASSPAGSSAGSPAGTASRAARAELAAAPTGRSTAATGTAPVVHEHTTAPPSTTSPPTTRPSPGPAAPPGPTPGTAACDGVVDAMASPFWDHVETAHLQASPSQQIADATDTDQYVLAHTALVESILAPLVGLVLLAPEATGPLWSHIETAHLQTSPGQQAADLLDADDYLLAHTALVEAMLDPTAGAVVGSGEC